MQQIHDLLKSLGIRRTYKGYYYVADALRLVRDDESMMFYVSKTLYPEIAKMHNTTIKCVERDIRTIASGRWESEHLPFLESVAEIPLFRCPTSSEFIHILSHYLEKIRG